MALRSPAPVASRDLHGKRTGIPAEHRAWVLDRDQNRCKRCGTRAPLEIHHIVEVVDGGQHDVENLDVLCQPCHGEWTWSEPPDVTYAEWLRTPPGRWFVTLYARMNRDTAEGIGALLDVSRMTGVELLEMLNRIRKENLR